MEKSVSPQEVVLTLQSKGLHIALAESCTGGGVAARLTDAPGASSVFEFGIVCYSNRIKRELPGVQNETLMKHGAVSEQTACELALGARRLGSADLGLGITGLAGPSSEEGKPVGLIYISITDGVRTRTLKLETADSSDGCRERNRERAQDEALKLILSFTADR